MIEKHGREKSLTKLEIVITLQASTAIWSLPSTLLARLFQI